MSFHQDHENVHNIPIPLSSIKEDFLIREIVLTHDPDDCHRLDSEMLLHLVECTFCSTTDNAVVDVQQFDAAGTSTTDLVGSQEPISLIIYKISNEMLSKSFDEHQDLHRKTLALLEMLSNYRWDSKVVLALASFAHSFGLFWLILQLQSDNALAFSLATVKHLPKAVMFIRPKFKALHLLVKTMVKLIKFIIRIESMYLQPELVDDIARSKIYSATYWIFRSILVCSSQIADSRNLILEQVYSDRSVIAAWGLHSLGNKLNSLCNDLDKCQHQIATRFYDKLLHTFKEKQPDNQDALRTLFASQNEFPFKNPSSKDKCGILELKNKVVIVLISKPEPLPLDKLFLLVQQTKTKENYAILWIPISCSWSLADKTTFDFFSNYIPWLSILRPWSLNPMVIKYIKQEWNFVEDPIMVVLNENGIVTNRNAIDMVWIWGPKAFPFSMSREKQMWEEEDLTMDLIIDGINPLLIEWVEQGKNLCLYGSENIDWIREFNAKINNSGIQLELVYVGCKNPGENVGAIINTIYEENLCISLTLTKVHLFWFRLEIMKRSILDLQDSTENSDKIAKKLSALLDFKGNENWAVMGRGSSPDVVELDGEKLEKCTEHVMLWGKNVAAMGLTGAIRNAVDQPDQFGGEELCQHVEYVPYEEGLIEKSMICGSCKRLMENKFVYYRCDG